jgi:signal transduction histidine kinase/ActR/RegA family two-component response regulator
MRSVRRPWVKLSLKIRRRLNDLYVPLWAKGIIWIALIFLLPLVVFGYVSVANNIRSAGESLYQNFYLRAEAFGLELRTFLKDNVDLRVQNKLRVSNGEMITAFEPAIPESVRSTLQQWMHRAHNAAGQIEFFTDPVSGKPRLIYVEKKDRVHFYIFEAAFLSQLLDVSRNVGTDDQIFLYNAQEMPFLSNSIENNYRVPANWRAAIHKVFGQQEMNSIIEIGVENTEFIVARYRLKDLPLIVYLARPTEIALKSVRDGAIRLVEVFAIYALIVVLLILFFLRGQLSTFRHLRSFIAGKRGGMRARRMYLIRDERANLFSDIVQMRTQEKRALIERDRAEARTRARGNFLANMSHEIRNPLNAILGITDLLRAKTGDNDDKRYLELIRESGDNLVQIINDILDISKIESAHLILEQVPFDLIKLINDMRSFFQPRAEAGGNELSIRVHEPMTTDVLGDENRVRQILTNLLSNALKFTENGAIYVRLRRYAKSDHVYIWVHDRGIGIAANDLSRIFSAYEQAEIRTARKYGGSGLGLHIALSLAQIMDGNVRCRSRVGHGTSFLARLRLPEAPAPSEAENLSMPQAAATQATIKLRVLVAEDNAINQLLMEENLRELVAVVEIAENGSEAVQKAKLGKFDLIFMDILMPEMDGYQATRQIRAHERAHGKLRMPIIALSGNAMPEDVAEATAAGCDAHLAKPVKREQLIGALKHFFPG